MNVTVVNLLYIVKQYELPQILSRVRGSFFPFPRSPSLALLFLGPEIYEYRVLGVQPSRKVLNQELT